MLSKRVILTFVVAAAALSAFVLFWSFNSGHPHTGEMHDNSNCILDGKKRYNDFITLYIEENWESIFNDYGPNKYVGKEVSFHEPIYVFDRSAKQIIGPIIPISIDGICVETLSIDNRDGEYFTGFTQGDNTIEELNKALKQDGKFLLEVEESENCVETEDEGFACGAPLIHIVKLGDGSVGDHENPSAYYSDIHNILLTIDM